MYQQGVETKQKKLKKEIRNVRKMWSSIFFYII